MSMKVKVRFWHYWNGSYVRIMIYEGQTIIFGRCHPTDEGYHCEGALTRFDGKILEQEAVSNGGDCDGPFSSGYTLICDVDEPAAIPAGEPDICRPDWKVADSFQRDYHAAALGC